MPWIVELADVTKSVGSLAVFHNESDPNSRKTEDGTAVVVVAPSVVEVAGRLVEVAGLVVVGATVVVGWCRLVVVVTGRVVVGATVVVVVPAGQLSLSG